jgi:hypothetical protein
VGFKEDVTFRRYLTMGAYGTAHVARDLDDRFGHRAIELERYSMANKVWTRVKVKRLRIPDLVCLRCGRRVESKGKSDLEVKLSDSETVGREWHAGGMRPDDLFAFIRVNLDVTPVAVGRPTYLTGAGLRSVVELAKRSSRKSASEGSEIDRAWQAWKPRFDGTFLGVDNQGRMTFRRPSGKTGTYWQSSRWQYRYLYLAPGDRFVGEETIVAGVVPPPETVQCPGHVWDLAADVQSADQTTRYAAVKAIGITDQQELAASLVAIADDPGEDWRVRLEARGSLARLDPERWLAPLAKVATNVSLPPPEQMEATFILSELPYPDAAAALAEVAKTNADREEEVRSAAVWGLGTGTCPEPDRVMPYLTDATDLVAIHAAAALPDGLAQTTIDELDKAVRSGDARFGPVAAAILARRGHVDVLVKIASDDGPGRLWALEALGDFTPDEVEAAAGGTLDEGLRSLLEPMWVRHEDWLRSEQNAGGLDVLGRQRLRFDPVQPQTDPAST